MSGEQRVIYVPAPAGGRLDEQQMRAALSVPPEHPLLRTVLQILQEEMAAAVLDAADPQMEPGKGTHAGGRVEALSAVLGRIEALKTGPETQKARNEETQKAGKRRNRP